MIPLSKSKFKYIKSLHLKKNRLQEGKFIVEGDKSVREFLHSDFNVEEVVATARFYEDIDNHLLPSETFLVTSAELAGLGQFKSNNAALAIVQIKDNLLPRIKENEITLAVDGINDPGNLGTIIRLADWFGIDKIMLSSNSVDVYNPKVVSATKGSLTRVKVFYTNLLEQLSKYKGSVYAAALDGQALKDVKPIDAGIILMGSETHGISNDLSAHISQKITIMGYGGAESLNVAVATGIICHQLVK